MTKIIFFCIWMTYPGCLKIVVFVFIDNVYGNPVFLR